MDEAKRREIAIAQHKKKLDEEARFSPAVLALLNTMADEMQDSYASHRIVINAQDFHQDWIDLLLKEYEKLTHEWGNILTSKQENRIDDNLAAALFVAEQRIHATIAHIQAVKDHRLQEFTIKSSIEHARDITTTNQREIDSSISAAVSLLLAQGLDVSDSEVARLAAESLKQNNIARSQIISLMEVNNAAEGAKSIEADSINDTIAATGVVLRAKKYWGTMGDARVRPAHASASGQTVDADAYFVVGGEELYRPLDPSGSPGNIMGCRCNAVYFMG